MKYQVSQKIFALGGDFTVRDEGGREVYYFDGKVFNFCGKKVEVLNAQRQKVARIAKQPFTFRQTYKIKRNGIVAATIKKRPMTVREQFVIDVPGTNDYRIIGDYVGHEYTITRGSQDVARVSKRFFGATDSYGVEIESGDPVILLSAVIVIDMALFKSKRTKY